MDIHEFVTVHAMKACGVNTGTDPFILNRQCLEKSGKLHAPAALPHWKEPSLPFEHVAGWAPELVWTFWRRN